MSLIKDTRCKDSLKMQPSSHNTAQRIDMKVEQEVGIGRTSVRTPVLHQESLHTLVTTVAFLRHLQLSTHSNVEVLEQSTEQLSNSTNAVFIIQNTRLY